MGNNNTTASNTNNGNATDDTLRHMVDDRDWAGIVKFLKEKDSAKIEAIVVFDLLTSIRSSPFSKKLMIELLEDRDSEETVELISMLIIILGGQELVMREFVFDLSNNGGTLLHAVCRYNQSIDLVSKLINVGGEALVRVKNRYGKTSLDIALRYKASNDVVLKLIEVGGKALVLEKGGDGQTSLHIAVDLLSSFDDNSLATINHLIQYGGTVLLNERNDDGLTPLESIIIEHDEDDRDEEEENKERHRANCSCVASLLIKRGIELQVEGEYGIGGLLSTSSDQEVKEKIYDKWDSVVLPALEQVMTEPRNRQLPILQALIVHEAPKNIIEDAIDRFPHSINTQDSFGKYPIDLAVQHGLVWDGGMQNIVNAFASSQQMTTIHVCAKHGVQWENGTKEVVEGNALDVIERVDDSTGLYPFMVAAVGGEYKYDFDSVFHMIKKSALLVVVRR